MKLPSLLPRGPGWFFILAVFAVVFIFVPLRAAEPHTVPGIGLKLMPIPAGTFTMGSPSVEPGRNENEEPLTDVSISQPFWLGQTEVTHGQWKALMKTDLVEQARRMLADESLYTLAGKQQTVRARFGLKKTTDPATLVFNVADDAPMYWVSWEDADEFCRKLNALEEVAGRLPKGYVYRLPTEAEWEYSCRAGTKSATYAGQMKIEGQFNAPVLDPIAWYGGNSSVGYTGNGFDSSRLEEKQYPGGKAAQRAVGTKQPNAWGLHDMLGNVNEWCGDWYAENLPGRSVSDPRGPNTGQFRLLRGGSWYGSASVVRAAFRYYREPGVRHDFIGFRVALAPVAP